MQKGSFSLQLARPGSVCLLTATSAQAMIHVVVPEESVTLPIDVDSSTNYYWDIDGNDVTDFRFQASTGIEVSTVRLFMDYGKTSVNGFVSTTQDGHGAAGLKSGFAIGPSLPSGYDFRTFTGSNRRYTSLLSFVHRPLADDATIIQVHPYKGSFDSPSALNYDFFMGFQFDIAGQNDRKFN